MSNEQTETVEVKITAETKAFDKEMERIGKQAESMGNMVASAMEEALKGGKELEQVFKGLALDLSTSFFKSGIAPLQKLVSGQVENIAGSLLQSLFAVTQPGLAAAGGLTPFAKGGVVGGPTVFPMQSGMGLMGEAGAEAILPLARGADGRLGVQTNGSPQAPVSVVMNISTPDAQSFAKSQNQIAIKLARAVGRGRRGL